MLSSQAPQHPEGVPLQGAEIGRKPLSTAPLPTLLLGKMLNLQEYEAPIQGWVEGVYHPPRNPERMIILSLPEAPGLFRWTSLGETDLQDRPKRCEVPLPDINKLGIDSLIYFLEKRWNVRIPWEGSDGSWILITP